MAKSNASADAAGQKEQKEVEVKMGRSGLLIPQSEYWPGNHLICVCGRCGTCDMQVRSLSKPGQLKSPHDQWEAQQNESPRDSRKRPE
jgi:hypothetical protein